jgi:hypothetical protein
MRRVPHPAGHPFCLVKPSAIETRRSPLADVGGAA